MGALDDIMNGKRLVRSAMSQVNQQSANTGNSTDAEGKNLAGALSSSDASKAAVKAAQAGKSISQATKITPPTLSIDEKPESKWGKVAEKIKAANNADLLQYFKRPKTNEELEEEERKQKRNETLARIGDGIGAFHDAYSYARGVKPLERSNMSEKSRQRYEKLRAEWNQDRDSYVNAVLRQAQERRADANAEANAQYRRDTIELRRQKEQNQQELNSIKLKYWDAKAHKEADRQEYFEKLYELVERGMTEKDARVALGIEPKTTYTVTDKHDSSGKNTTTVTTRTGNPDVANARIDDVNAGKYVAPSTTTTPATTGTTPAKTTNKSGKKATGGNKKPKGSHAKKTYSSVSALGIGG